MAYHVGGEGLVPSRLRRHMLIFVLIEATLLRPAYVSTSGELMNSSNHVPTGEQQVVCFYVIT